MLAAPPKAQCDYCKNHRSLRGWRGRMVCGPCWDWYKLRINEARYWVKAIDALFSNDLGTGPDPNDLMLWTKWGIADEVIDALNTLDAIRDRYEVMLQTDGEEGR